MAHHQLDKLDKKILRIISRNARTPFLEVARECKVSGAAVHQRVQKLLQAGVVKGSEFVINTQKVGYHTCAYIGVVVSDVNQSESVIARLREVLEVVECHFTTGRFSMLIKVYAQDNRHLLQLLVGKINTIPGIAHTETILVSLDEVFHRQVALEIDGE
ncbi:MAG: Lrp/AsnC ligand binding domain-containing protein [Paludibacteraceae bacterium]|nr:Lrp/AsnC ligand binding domain-containing protein [Paludibacteraceae bacterium]